jgi:ABC-type dipeptide/oligopeptide/nickel transport system permease component
MNGHGRKQRARRQAPLAFDSGAVLLVTFLLTLLVFAISLLLGILGVVIAARLRGLHPNMSIAYRYIALPTAAIAAAIVLIFSSVMEIRRYRQTKALAEIERISI